MKRERENGSHYRRTRRRPEKRPIWERDDENKKKEVEEMIFKTSMNKRREKKAAV